MRIIFLIRSLGYGGAERQLVALALRLHARGHEVRVAVFYGGGPLEGELRAAGIPVIDLRKHGRWDLPRFVLRLARTLRAQHPELVHGYLGGANILALLTKPFHRARVVWGVRASDIDMSGYDWFSRVDFAVGCFLARFPELIIANSHAGKRHAVAHGYPARSMVVIPNGIDTARFRPDPDAGRRLRTELGVAPDDVLIGRIGRIAPQKDYPTFLRAAAVVARAEPAARFLCVGAGSEADLTDLRILAETLGIAERVLWTGPRDDMRAVYNALDVHVSSSAHGEGTPNVVAEAMACGTPCVVTDVGDCAVTVGELGQVVPAGDPDALGAAVTALLARLRRGEVDRAPLRAWIVQHFSLDQLELRTLAALRSTLDGGVPAAGLTSEATP